jgi:hypothetical protein
MQQGLAGSPAAAARLRPSLAPAAARLARPPDRHVESHHTAAPGFFGGQADVRRDDVGVRTLPEEGVTHAVDDVDDRREVDGDFVGEALVRHQPELTIGAGPALVKA